jgi:hypothetical protein
VLIGPAALTPLSSVLGRTLSSESRSISKSIGAESNKLEPEDSSKDKFFIIKVLLSRASSLVYIAGSRRPSHTTKRPLTKHIRYIAFVSNYSRSTKLISNIDY